MQDQKNEMHTELLSLHALNFSADKNSSARQVMFSSHFAQRLVIKGSTEKRIQTGVEQDLANYTFSVRMPCDGRILKVISRYPARVDMDAIPMSPETLVIYEDNQTKEIGCFSVPTFGSYHQYFGFEYVQKEAMQKLVPGNFIEKDTIFADSSSVSENGGFKYGIELNTALMSHPAVSEDGILISRDVLDRLKFKVYETRTVEFGTSNFPLNLYGSATKYKPFPEIGEMIRDDGVLMMLREYNYDLMPVAISIYDCVEPDYIFDKAVYVRGPRGRIVDIKVYRDNSLVSQTPSGIMDNMEKYSRALRQYYQEIVDTHKAICNERKKKFGENKVVLKPEFHRLLVEGFAILSDQNGRVSERLNKVYRKAPMDDYRVEFVIEYELQPVEGFKLTASYGDKGVICQIEEPENMPVDQNGVRADIVMDSGSTINRMNLGRLYEHYLGSAALNVTAKLRAMLGNPLLNKKTIAATLKSMDQNLLIQAYHYLLGFYEIISPRQHLFFSDLLNNGSGEWLEHLTDTVLEGVYLYYPIENTVDAIEMVKKIESIDCYRPAYGPVTYVGNSGKRVTTEENVRIGPMYMMVLEKIADDWSSVSSGKLQHFGVLSPMTKSEKYAYPFRNNPVRTIGETEGRIFAAYCGREAIAEMMDRSNNPTTHKHIVNKILSADKPTNIEKCVDRDLIPLGASKPLQLVNHMAMISGWSPIYEPPEKK